MSKDLTNVQALPYQGQFYSVPVAALISSTSGALVQGRIMGLNIDWLDYGAGTNKPNVAVLVNMASQQVQTPITAPRSIYIDNTYSDVTIYVRFPDTGYTVVCPPGDILLIPIFTKVSDFLVYGEGFFTGRVPKTTIHVSDVPAEGVYIPTDFNVSANVRASLVGFNSTPSPRSDITFTFDIGFPNERRLIACIAFVGRVSDLNNVTYLSATIGGIPATLAIQDVEQVYTEPSDPLSSLATQTAIIFYAIVPTGTSIPVVLNLNGTSQGFVMSAFIIEGYSQSVPYSANVAKVSNTGSVPCVLDALTGGAAIFGSIVRIGAADPINHNPPWFGVGVEPVSTWENNVAFGTIPPAYGSFAIANASYSGILSATTLTSQTIGALWV